MEEKKISIEEKEKLRRKSFKLRLELLGLKIAEGLITFIIFLGIQILLMIPILNVFVFLRKEDDLFKANCEIHELRSKLKKYEQDEVFADNKFHGYQPEATKKED